MSDVPERDQPHEIDVIYVPICSVCHRDVNLEGGPMDEHWEHYDHQYDIPRP